MREFVSPFKVGSPALKAAHLEARLSAYDQTKTIYNLTVANGTDGTSTLSYVGPIGAGVYRLRLTSLDGHCCYSGLVWVEGCPAATSGSAGATGSHNGAGGVPTPVPSC